MSEIVSVLSIEQVTQVTQKLDLLTCLLYSCHFQTEHNNNFVFSVKYMKYMNVPLLIDMKTIIKAWDNLHCL